MIKQLGCIALTLSLLACQQVPAPATTMATVSQTPANDEVKTATTASPDKVVCEQSRTTGSFIKSKRCRTVAQIEEERKDAQSAMQGIRSTTGSKGN